MDMNILITDIIVYITNMLRNDQTKMNFLSSSKYLAKIKNQITYNKYIKLSVIRKLWYFDQFTNIEINETDIVRDNHVASVVSQIQNKINVNQHEIFEKFIRKINFNPLNLPAKVKKVVINFSINKKLYDCMPTSITHVTFNYNIDPDLYNNISPNVTNITIGNIFNINFNVCLTPNVTHLTFNSIRPYINGSIPVTITHLTLGGKFNQSDFHNRIPNSVTHLTFGDNFYQRIKNYIPDSVKYLIFGYSFNLERSG